MTSSHICNFFKKRSRSDSFLKSSIFRSLWCSDVKKFDSSQISQFVFADDNAQILEQFRSVRESEEHYSEKNSNDDVIRRRKFYTRKHKLAAINYVTITWKIHKDDIRKLINKYEATKNLEITTTMLCTWMKSIFVIENISMRVRKHKFINVFCQEMKMKRQLIELFKQKKEADMKIDKKWFIRQAKHIYEELYSHRVIRFVSKRDEYLRFKFSNEWFRNFRNRIDISSKTIIKKAQMISENLRVIIQKWLQYNRRNSQLLSDQMFQHDDERYRLDDIENMNQTSIAYEFLENHSYDFKKANIIWAKTHRSEWNKRQVTLMLFVSANEINRCKSLIIFKNKDK
jgi:hypothetical protein